MVHQHGRPGDAHPLPADLRDDTEVIVVGYARLFGEHLDNAVLDILQAELGPSADGDWGAVFTYIRDPGGEPVRLTIFTASMASAQRLAGTGGGLAAMPLHEIVRQFPRVHPGWLITVAHGDRGQE